MPEPAVPLGPQTEFDPDLVVVRMDQIGGAKFTEPPLLAVEIRPPSTALIDLTRKKAAYERPPGLCFFKHRGSSLPYEGGNDPRWPLWGQ